MVLGGIVKHIQGTEIVECAIFAVDAVTPGKH